jgi:hypothetical protein
MYLFLVQYTPPEPLPEATCDIISRQFILCLTQEEPIYITMITIHTHAP